MSDGQDQQGEPTPEQVKKRRRAVCRDVENEISSDLFDRVCNPDDMWAGLDDWSSEDPDESGRDAGVYPIVYVSPSGERYEVEVSVSVRSLGTLLADQQPTPDDDVMRLAVVNLSAGLVDSIEPSRQPGRLSAYPRWLCTQCGGSMVRAWIAFDPDTLEPLRDGARGVAPAHHADCEHFAVCAARPDWWLPGHRGLTADERAEQAEMDSPAGPSGVAP